MMETTLIIIAVILCIAGLLGCIVPALPGPPMNFIAMLLVQWAFSPFRLRTIIAWCIITVIVVMLDYLIPVWTARKFGATRQGINGAVIGMFIGMFFTPVGMIGGLIIGSIAGDLMARRTLGQAATAAAGSIFGTLLTIGIKLICAGWMTLLVIIQVWHHFSEPAGHV